MSLQGCRVLIVEDNYLVGTQVATLIEQAGATVYGPFPTTSRAMFFAISGKIEGAVLDVQLADGPSLPIAQALRRGGVPFIVVSGYGRVSIPREMRKAPFLSKPILGPELVSIAVRRFRLPDKTSVLGKTTELIDLAYRLRSELLALTGKGDVAVLVDILPQRLRIPPAVVDRALQLAERNGWLVRQGRGVRLTDLGRSPIPFPETNSSQEASESATDR